MKKIVSRGRPISVCKDVEVEVDVYLDEFETDELLEELKRRTDWVDYKAVHEEVCYYVERLREARVAGVSTDAAISNLIWAVRGAKTV